jgi:hypothetical protein
MESQPLSVPPELLDAMQRTLKHPPDVGLLNRLEERIAHENLPVTSLEHAYDSSSISVAPGDSLLLQLAGPLASVVDLVADSHGTSPSPTSNNSKKPLPGQSGEKRAAAAAAASRESRDISEYFSKRQRPASPMVVESSQPASKPKPLPPVLKPSAPVSQADLSPPPSASKPSAAAAAAAAAAKVA